MEEKRFFVYQLLNEKQKAKFDSLANDTRLYECTEDRQGGEFAVGFVGTIQDWLDRAFEWLDSDGYFEEDQVFVNYLLENPNKAIEEIDDFWEITIIEVKGEEK